MALIEWTGSEIIRAMNPFTPTTLASLAQQHGTPLWVYDAATIRRQAQALRQFDVVRFAQKANSNTHILRLLKSQGVMVDAVSLGEDFGDAMQRMFRQDLANSHAITPAAWAERPLADRVKQTLAGLVERLL